MRNWKVIAKKVEALHPGGRVLLESPHVPWEYLPEEAEEVIHDDTSEEFEGDDINAKDVRRLLWDNRNNRKSKRDRAFVVSRYDEDKNVSIVSLGTVTSKDVVERITCG